MLARTGVQAVSVARGCIGNPWVFRQARQIMLGQAPTSPTLAEQRAVLQEHFDLSVALHGEKPAGRMMRKFGIRFSVHHPLAAAVKNRFIAVRNAPDWQAVLREYYDTDEAGLEALRLRSADAAAPADANDTVEDCDQDCGM
jgi:tRNA-dihydrouridine synthase